MLLLYIGIMENACMQRERLLEFFWVNQWIFYWVSALYFTESLDGVSLSEPQLPYPECHFYEPILWFAIKAWTSLKKSANLGHSNFPGNSRESLRIPGKFLFLGNPKIRENPHHQLCIGSRAKSGSLPPFFFAFQAPIWLVHG